MIPQPKKLASANSDAHTWLAHGITRILMIADRLYSTSSVSPVEVLEEGAPEQHLMNRHASTELFTVFGDIPVLTRLEQLRRFDQGICLIVRGPSRSKYISKAKDRVLAPVKRRAFVNLDVYRLPHGRSCPGRNLQLRCPVRPRAYVSEQAVRRCRIKVGQCSDLPEGETLVRVLLVLGVAFVEYLAGCREVKRSDLKVYRAPVPRANVRIIGLIGEVRGQQVPASTLLEQRDEFGDVLERQVDEHVSVQYKICLREGLLDEI